MNAPAVIKSAPLPALQMNEVELMAVLESSLYPGAKQESIKLVIGYCKASGLDPMQKPVHLVPMSVKKAGTRDQYEWRDVVMPGIGLYRTQAARSGCYAGMTEPEFGEDVTETLGNVSITFPKWCKTTIKRQMPNGTIVEFTAKEFWKENYATAGKDSIAPNAMWKKRPYAQIAKCAEAQALRKAFPEIGAAPTAEEMEGKPLAYEGETFDGATGQPVQAQRVTEPQPYPAADFDKNLPSWRQAIAGGKKTADQIIAMVSSKGALTEEQKTKIRAPIEPAAPPDLFEQIKGQIEKATSTDTLDLAADLIGEVADPTQREALTALYQKRTDELMNG
jgi:phage recombination protein Bet